MDLYVIDNSVILKPLLHEEGAEKVEKLFFLKNQFRISILVPDLFRYEFFNKITKEYNASVALKSFQALTEYQISIIPLETDLIEAANRLVEKYPKISFYDATYHALAKAYDTFLITADAKYYEMTKKEGHVKLLEDLDVDFTT